MRAVRKLLLAVTLMAPMAVIGPPASANVIAPGPTIPNTDFAAFGFGGMRGLGTGSITVAGVSGTVTRALLYWQGPTRSTSSSANAAVRFAGTTVTGTQIGFASDNCWGFTNSQAYRADVTALVPGNGSYSLADFLKPDADINGVSLLVFFNDGNPANNRDVVIYEGNDSTIISPFDPGGWDATLAGINYSGGSANLQLHVGDGQRFTDDAVVVNGTVVAPAGAVFEGGSVPNGASAASTNGGLWDIRSFDVTSLLSPGPNTLNLTSGHFSDCLSLVVIAFDLPAGSAPGVPPRRPTVAICGDTAITPQNPPPGYNVIVGTAGPDTLVGTPGNDVIFGLDGNDDIDGGGGDDLVFGGPGNDRLRGGPGHDVLCAGTGNDRLEGGPGDDGLDGGPGNDLLLGQDGDDTLVGGPGFDQLDGGPGTNSNDGGPDADQCSNGVSVNCSP